MLIMTANPTHSDFWKYSATQIASLVSNGDISATEVAKSVLARINDVNHSLNAIVVIRPDDIMEQAQRIDDERNKGRPLGLLAGVPVSIKENVDQAGYATTRGSILHKDDIASENAPMVQGLVDASAVLLGRTNMPTYGYRWFTNNPLHGHTYNPRNRTLSPGGSSGGAASAVAAGMGPLAHASDIAGSIRYPAYACGVHGLRPTFGRVPAYNSSSGERTIGGQIMSVAGPIARTVDDLRLGLAAMSRADSRDPWYCPVPLTGPPILRRAAVCLHPDGMATAPEICAALLDAATKLRNAGWTVDEVDVIPPLKEAVKAHLTLWMGDGYDAQCAAAKQEGDAGAIAALAGQREFIGSLGVTALSTALKERATYTRTWQRYLEERYPVVLLPVSAELPFEDQLDLKDPASYERVWNAQTPMIALPLAGVPCLTLTTGFTSENIPIGIQLVASRFREDVCLAAAEAIEARSPAIPIAQI